MTYEPAAPVQQLFDAVWEGAEDAVVRLLRAGVPADATDEDGQTPLYRAAVSDELGIVRLLLAAGAEPERLSGHEGGDLPLCGAAVGGHTDVVLALIAAGARPDTAEAFGFTAMTWAVQLGHAATVEALLDHGADPDLPAPGANPRWSWPRAGARPVPSGRCCGTAHAHGRRHSRRPAPGWRVMSRRSCARGCWRRTATGRRRSRAASRRTVG